MLSHLRFHRRGTSNPTSPAPDQSSPSPHSNQHSPFSPDAVSPLEPHGVIPNTSSLPPTLPPIQRVTSTEMAFDFQLEEQQEPKPPVQDPRTQQVPRSLYESGSGFIGGVALQNYRRGVDAQPMPVRTENADEKAKGKPNLGIDGYSRPQRPTPTVNTKDLTPMKPVYPVYSNNRSVTSFSSMTSLQLPAVTAHRTHGSRPSGDPPQLYGNVAPTEPSKAKKGLPFLKNPMSTLLLRRKANQSQAKLPPVLSSRTEEPTYDPRIRGTRVHDFSAPRKKMHVPINDTTAQRSASRPSLTMELGTRADLTENNENAVSETQQRRQLSSASDPARPVSSILTAQTLGQSPGISANIDVPSTAPSTLSLDDQLAPPVPPKDEDTIPSLQTTPAKISGIKNRDVEALSKAGGSNRITRSRNVSLLSVPRHMKSTSSRFSFDMIGAAEQEKIMEDRHRQRELDKKAAQNEPRDSRFDDFDEDAFDYDAMMDDDGLEERIPGVNADYDDEYDQYEEDNINEDQYIENGYDEDETDPDNDQENFAGFVFQRSNDVSSKTSPRTSGLIPTPRDTEGKPIGLADTSYSPSARSNVPLSPNSNPDSPSDADITIRPTDSDLNHSHITDPPNTTNLPSMMSSGPAALPEQLAHARGDDDLYFDNGLTGYEDEFAEDLAGELDFGEAPFDESIFDNDDTDQYGRPVPGAFALAQSQRRAAIEQMSTQKFDIPSGILGQDGLGHLGTAPTSQIDEEATDNMHGETSTHEFVSRSVENTAIVAPQPIATNGDVIAVYQAALAAAAQKAAESGQFEREESPVENGAGHLQQEFLEQDPLQGYEDTMDDYGYSYDDVDDGEFDDDAIIAEANASALANDSDGWYGQEFGFYAAPVGSAQNSGNSKEPGDGNYANGGFFGPKGLDRSTSGRVISREPNLTPITERSEYSNRNSILSLGIPPINTGTPAIQSPGLAQLAMMADRGDDQMTLSALLRLRSRAWGGSQASLASSKDGSPRSEWGEGPNNFHGAVSNSFSGQGRKNSVFSIISRDSEPSSAPGSPTMTLAIPMLSGGPVTETMPTGHDPRQPSGEHVFSGSRPYHVQQGQAFTHMERDRGLGQSVKSASSMDVSTISDHNRSSSTTSQTKKGHRRQKSSADSISYMKEEDSGETRWVIERRRTGEFGQVEILEREFIEAGRI